MIKSIEELNNRHLSFISNFILNCTIEEKIDTYYVCVNIVSKSKLSFLKSNGQSLDRTDMIINEMWQSLVNDWTYFKMANEEWFYSHIGYKLYMFFLPVEKPLMTQYKKDVHYIIDRIESPVGDILVSDDCESEMKDMQYVNKFGIFFKKPLKRYETDVQNVLDEVKRFNKSEDSDAHFDFTDLFNSLINYNDSEVFAEVEPEGYIIKYNKNVYQIINSPEIKREVRQERSQYEFLLMDFIRFWNNVDDISKYTVGVSERSYCNIVCEIFNDYITQKESVSKYIENNVSLEGIQPPCVGNRFGICLKNIPNDLTIRLCEESELYENIFKVLLINLKKMKKAEHCVLMTDKDVEDWNLLVKTIENACVEMK